MHLWRENLSYLPLKGPHTPASLAREPGSPSLAREPDPLIIHHTPTYLARPVANMSFSKKVAAAVIVLNELGGFKKKRKKRVTFLNFFLNAALRLSTFLFTKLVSAFGIFSFVIWRRCSQAVSRLNLLEYSALRTFHKHGKFRYSSVNVVKKSGLINNLESAMLTQNKQNTLTFAERVVRNVWPGVVKTE
ncbi:hypothetical protein J6590_097619 [Homalodisca vitripennis]|nr:hypothetical protein J6590_097619 [Homalodisca vitripennis]